MAWSEWAADWLQRILTVLLLGFLSYAVPKAIALFGRLTKTKVTSETALAAVAYAEEQASKFAKGLIATGPGTPQEKLAVAKEYLRTLAPAAVAALSAIQIEQVIEAAVNIYRAQKTKSVSLPPVPPSLRPPA